jgi:exodeoxyribonuclease VII large subunit
MTLRLPFAEETYTVSSLGGEIKQFLNQAFDSLWVEGELARVRRVPRGHLYFELVEKGVGDAIVGRLDGAVFRSDLERVERGLKRAGVADLFADGRRVRLRAGVDFFPPSGKAQLVVREVDSTYTLGLLAKRRLETLAALESVGLLDRQRRLAWPALPLCVGLVTSEGSAAYHDFIATLRESGFGFRLRVAHASVQGASAENEMVRALRGLEDAGCDCVVLVRGGGGRSDLAAFDGRRLAEAIARHPLPLLTGLGHEIDDTVADRVAHRALKTPTQVAEVLVAQMREAERAVERARTAVLAASRGRLEASRRTLARSRSGLLLGAARLRAGRARIDGLARSLRAAVPRRLGAALAAIDARSRLLDGLRPERVLRRGYSITRGAGGRLLRAPSDVGAGERLLTTLAAGSITSRVEEAS